MALTSGSTPAINDLAALTTAHTDGGIKHIADGYYRVDVPDAAFAAGVDGVLISATATDMVGIGQYVQLVGADMRTEFTAAVLANLDAAVTSRLASSSYAPPSAGQVADAVLDEAGTGHTGLIPTNLDAKGEPRRRRCRI